MRVQKKISFLIVILSLQNCATNSNQNFTCKDFEIGKFELINTNQNRKYVIERSKNFQVEKTFDLTSNKKVKSDKYFFIDWKSACEYQLKIDTIKSEYDEIDLYINSLGGLHNKIIKIEGKCAEIETTFENQTNKSKICKQ